MPALALATPALSPPVTPREGEPGEKRKLVKALVCDNVPIGDILLAADWLYEYSVTTTHRLPAIWFGGDKTTMIHAIVETPQLKATTTGTVDPWGHDGGQSTLQPWAGGAVVCVPILVSGGQRFESSPVHFFSLLSPHTCRNSPGSSASRQAFPPHAAGWITNSAFLRGRNHHRKSPSKTRKPSRSSANSAMTFLKRDLSRLVHRRRYRPPRPS